MRDEKERERENVLEKKWRIIERGMGLKGMSRSKAPPQLRHVLLLAAVLGTCNSVVPEKRNCELDTLQDEFGTVLLPMVIEQHARCCGALRRFLKTAQSGPQPWKIEV